jgi:periplasmic protein CpxP/Spy
MSILRTLPSMAAACGLTLFTFHASAQEAPAAPDGQAQHGGQHWAQHRAEMREHMEHARAERLKTLHDALSIRPDQEGAWQAFVAATAPQPREHNEHKEMGAPGEHHHLTTPERLDRMQKRMEERMAAFQRHAAAVKALYAALTPAQQKTFDALARLHGMHGMHGGFRHGGMGGGHGMGPGGE